MDQLIAGFTKQLTESLEIGRNAQLSANENEIKNVVVSGLGGSGIGANLVSEIIADQIKIPFSVNKDYHLPNYVDKNTLLIISSYSGNTEETLQALDSGIQKNAQIVCVSSGGKVIEIAQQQGLGQIIIPGGMPPRSCLGYSFVQQLFILDQYGLIDNFYQPALEDAIKLLEEEEDNIKLLANDIAGKLANKIPIIYVACNMESIAVRFRQQVNENSKMLAWHHAIPEMNHNELVGWRKESDDIAVVFFRNEDDYIRIQQRIEINKEIIRKYTTNITEIYSKGNSFIEQAMYLIHVGDWISYYLAANRNMDAVEVEVIDFLKGELAKLEMPV